MPYQTPRHQARQNLLRCRRLKSRFDCADLVCLQILKILVGELEVIRWFECVSRWRGRRLDRRRRRSPLWDGRILLRPCGCAAFLNTLSRKRWTSAIGRLEEKKAVKYQSRVRTYPLKSLRLSRMQGEWFQKVRTDICPGEWLRPCEQMGPTCPEILKKARLFCTKP
jgi:hypothetical protein